MTFHCLIIPLNFCVLTLLLNLHCVTCTIVPEAGDLEEKLTELFPSSKTIIIIHDCSVYKNSSTKRHSHVKYHKNLRANATEYFSPKLLDLTGLERSLNLRYYPVQSVCTNLEHIPRNRASKLHSQEILFILEMKNSSQITSFLKVCTQFLKPKKIFQAYYFIVNNGNESALMTNEQFKNIPYKMELKATAEKDKSHKLLLWTYSSHLIDGSEFGSVKSRKGFVLIGAFTISGGYSYKTYSSWFPDMSNHLHGSIFHVFQPVPHKIVPHLDALWKAGFNPYRLISEAIAESFEMKLIEYPSYIENSILTILIKNDQHSYSSAQRLSYELKAQSAYGFSTVYFRTQISDQFIQCSVPYKPESYGLAYLQVKPSLGSIISNFMLSYRWLVLLGLITFISIIITESAKLIRVGKRNVIPQKWSTFPGVFGNLCFLFIEQRILLIKGITFFSLIILVHWGFFSIFYTFMWRLDILDEFVGRENIVRIKSFKDLIYHNNAYPDIQFKIVTYLSSEILQDSIEVEGIDWVTVMMLTKGAETTDGDSYHCISKTLTISSAGEHYVCFGPLIDLAQAAKVFKHNGDNRFNQYEIAVLGSIPAYQSLAFSYDFPYMEKVNSRIHSLVESGRIQRLYMIIAGVQKNEIQNYYQKLVDRFTVEVNFEVVYVILQTLSWCFFAAFGIWIIENFTYCKQFMKVVKHWAVVFLEKVWKQWMRMRMNGKKQQTIGLFVAREGE